MPSVVVLWSPGVGRELAHRLIEREGLLALDARAGKASIVNHCVLCGSSLHGRPSLTPLRGQTPHISISYASDLTVVALTRAGPVGVDAERVDAADDAGIDGVVGHPQETLLGSRASLTTWVRKESLLKATGRGLIVDPRDVLLSPPSEPPALLEWAASDPQRTPVWLFDVELGDEHLAAVTVLSTDRPELVVTRADLAAPSR